MGSVDGADLGFTPKGALNAVLGGDQSGVGQVNDMATYLDSAPAVEELGTTRWDDGYDTTAQMMGKIFLDYLREHPEDRDLPTDAEGAFEVREDGTTNYGNYMVVKEGLYDKVRDRIPEALTGLSGFQVGWAANAARSALGIAPGDNPAIVTIG
jgi:hypothetical protein